jgi:hypothetical protein
VACRLGCSASHDVRDELLLFSVIRTPLRTIASIAHWIQSLTKSTPIVLG